MKQSNIKPKNYLGGGISLLWWFKCSRNEANPNLGISLQALLFLLHPANRYEAKIFKQIIEEPKQRRILRQEVVLIFDRGFYAYKNYLIGLKCRIIPLIFPRKNFIMKRLDGLLSYPLSIFNSKV